VLRDSTLIDVAITPENGKVGIGNKMFAKKLGPGAAMR